MGPYLSLLIHPSLVGRLVSKEGCCRGSPVWTVDLLMWSVKWVPSLRIYDMQTLGSGIWAPVSPTQKGRTDNWECSLYQRNQLLKWLFRFPDSLPAYSGQDKRASVKLHVGSMSGEQLHPPYQSHLQICAALFTLLVFQCLIKHIIPESRSPTLPTGWATICFFRGIWGVPSWVIQWKHCF